MLVKNLHIMNSIWAMILPGAISAYNLITARMFIRENIPQELFEASVVDGCSDVRYYLSILLPLSKAVISVLLLFYAVGHCHCEDGVSDTLQDSFGFRTIAWENFDACSHDVIDPRRLDKEPGDSNDYFVSYTRGGVWIHLTDAAREHTIIKIRTSLENHDNTAHVVQLESFVQTFKGLGSSEIALDVPVGGRGAVKLVTLGTGRR